jgi:penicillin-binding protein 2
VTTATEIWDPGKFKLPTASHVYRDWKKNRAWSY